MARLCEPDQVVWIDGTEEVKARLTQEALSTGELLPLNQKKLPGYVYHRTAVNDVPGPRKAMRSRRRSATCRRREVRI